ncbi:MAG TPA: CBS domain-containing protein [Planctomycetota bacterium]|nr:CBS domain-containing protein [Planctomycetota bacterium]
MIKLGDIMNRKVHSIHPMASVKGAADLMRSLDLSVLPVCQDGKILGVIADRDMTVHIAATGRDPGTTFVKDILNPKVAILSEDDSLQAAERIMEEKGSHWIFVTDQDRTLVGIVSLGKVARKDNPKAAGNIVRKISRSRRNVG